jgi:signal transduction histidine kinase
VYLQYLEQRELYLNLFVKILYGTKLLPKNLLPISERMDKVITIMNFGILVFIYSSLSFSLSFFKPLKKNKKLYLLLAIPLVIQFLFYCPWIYEYVYRLVFYPSNNHIISFNNFYKIDEYIYYGTSIINYLNIFFGLFFMVYQYIKTPQIKYFQSYFLLIFSCYISIILLFLVFFWWAPKRLISLTTSPGSMHILPVSILIEGKMLNFFPYITIIIFVIMLYSLYRFNHFYLNLKNMRSIIVKSLDISNNGIRFYNHMLKNFVMAIQIDAERLKNRLLESPNLLPYLNRIISSTQELLKNINHVQSRVSLVSLNLNLYNVKEIIDLALQRVNLESVTLKYYYDEEKHFALVDPDHMKEAFVNILNNSIQAMTGETKILSIDIRKHKLWIYISISDTGIGIQKQEINKIFLPFYSTKDRKENWGLGLTYCYRIIMAHRGKLYVESEPGKGTIVKILLPLIE